VLVRHNVFKDLGCCWSGYHIGEHMNFKDWDEIKKKNFVNFHSSNLGNFDCEGTYDTLSQDVGAWVYYKMAKAGYGFSLFKEEHFHHLKAISWDKRPDEVKRRINDAAPYINELENLIEYADKQQGVLPGGFELY